MVNPVTMTFGPDGRLYVVEWQAGRGPNDHIKVLTDDDGDGTFDRAAIYMDGLDLPAGVLFWDGWTYVTLEHDVVRFRDADGDGKFEAREAIVTGFGNDNSHHRVSGLTLGPTAGSTSRPATATPAPEGSDGSSATVLRSRRGVPVQARRVAAGDRGVRDAEPVRERRVRRRVPHLPHR